jgi:pyruvate formate lyase activating enzyme
MLKNRVEKHYKGQSYSSRDMTNEDWLELPSVKEVPLHKDLGGGKVQCGVCEHRCKISEGKRGICQCRANINGKLYTLTYGDISALESRPIEIKPFFHFWPGSSALTFSTWGCNLRCPWCQNHHLSKNPPEPGEGHFVPPERVIERAVSNKDHGICISFNEPLMLFEYSLDIFPMAREKDLYNTYVSNGYMTPEALKMLKDAGLDGLKIDVKGGPEAYKKFCKAKEKVVWRNAKSAKEMGIHVEIVNLVIPTVNVDTVDDLIAKHLEFVGQDTPLHFTRYHPDFEFNAARPKVEVLEKAIEKARDAGVRFVYIGNVQGHKAEDTVCPECGIVLIKRSGYSVKFSNISKGKCPSCGSEIPITGEIIV